jgi:hypothetical protein
MKMSSNSPTQVLFASFGLFYRFYRVDEHSEETRQDRVSAERVVFPSQVLEATVAREETPSVPRKPGMLHIKIRVFSRILARKKGQKIAANASRIHKRVAIGSVDAHRCARIGYEHTTHGTVIRVPFLFIRPLGFDVCDHFLVYMLRLGETSYAAAIPEHPDERRFGVVRGRAVCAKAHLTLL